MQLQLDQKQRIISQKEENSQFVAMPVRESLLKKISELEERNRSLEEKLKVSEVQELLSDSGSGFGSLSKENYRLRMKVLDLESKLQKTR